MSVDREISLGILTNRNKFSDLFNDFMIEFDSSNNNFNFLSLKVNDLDNFDYVNYKNFKDLKPILDERENKEYSNYVSFFIDCLNERFLISSTKIEDTYEGFSSHFEIKINLGVGKRIENANQYTDYGFYLNNILPRLLRLNCYVIEVICRDLNN